MTKTANIPHGFKNSPLGFIPEDWEVKRLIDVCINSNRAIVDGPFGSNLKTIHFRKTGIPVINSSFVTSMSFFADEYKYVDEELFMREIRSKVVPGDIIMAKIGARCGSCAVMPKNHPISILSGNSLKISISDNNSIDYVLAILQKQYRKDQFSEYKSVGAQPAISIPLLKKMPILVPPLPEQQKIAEILSVWDAAIEKQTALIEKLQLRKRGLMQQLLTGKIRLRSASGERFGGEWKNVKLGDVCEIKKGVALSSIQIGKGNYPVIAGGKESPYSHSEFTDENVITISSSGAYAGYVAYHNYKIWASDCSVIKKKELTSEVLFLYYFLAFNQEKIYKLQSGGAQPHVFPKDLIKMKLKIPSLPEQTAIAEMLSTADKEIDASKKKLEQLRMQKKGLMQVLLSGRVRVKNNP